MPGVSREQIARAKEMSIEDYILSHEPNNVKRVGSAYYLKDHESLEISNGLWNWHSHGMGGKNVIDYLIFVRGYGFVDAVRHLGGDEIISEQNIEPKARPPTGKKQSERVPFKLPSRHADNERVVAYLEKRGIDKSLIYECIRQGILYESSPWHNAVFLGRDDNGKTQFAALRGTLGDFKRDADGSDKRFGFGLPHNGDSHSVAVFESPIDLLSHTVLEPQFSGYRLSLGGTALVALTHFLEQHKEIENITICTDNDKAGNLTATKITELPGYNIMRLIPPNNEKDWNDALISIRNEVKLLEDKRKTIRFVNRDSKTLFTIKDGDSIKLTLGYDGEVKSLKCRFIDEAHITLIGKFNNDYHIDEFAGRMEQAGNKYEPIPNQKPMLDILAAKYGENLQHAEVPMTETAIKRLVGSKYTTEPLCGASGEQFAVLVRGAEGVAVCGVADGTLTSLHPYWEQKYKRELSPVEPPVQSNPIKAAKKPSLLGDLETAKAEAKALNAANGVGNKTQNRSTTNRV
jgi:hypothetical protein